MLSSLQRDADISKLYVDGAREFDSLEARRAHGAPDCDPTIFANWNAMAVSIMAGLGVGSGLTIVLYPTLYATLHRIKESGKSG